MSALKLWDVDHAYYCNELNYYHNDSTSEFKSWAAFLSEEGDSDFDMNLVFRWDWEGQVDGEDKPVHVPDDNYRGFTLKLFYIGQRKGLFRSVTVEVCRADEPAVRAWLQPRWEHLRKLWEPVASR